MSEYNPLYTGNAKHSCAADALNRALICADSINALLTIAFCDVKEGEVEPSNMVISGCLWAMDGFIREATQLSDLIYHEGYDAGLEVKS